MLAAGVVLTGGTTIMEGIEDMAEQIFNLPVRKGMPSRIGGLTDVVRSPVYATGVGLVLAGSTSTEQGRFKVRERNIYTKVRGRMKEWLGELF